jgi:lipid-A-disaccharide synthase
MITIGIVVNEPSGDLLGSLLVRALQTDLPAVRFVGVAGPHLLQLGCESLFPFEQLTAMGLTEVIQSVPRLMWIRRQLKRYFLAHPPDLFIGVDAPDFNLNLEACLRAAGIPTVHVVSPTVWAWRPGRVVTIRRAVDLLLSLFPFEEAFLTHHQVPVRYIGHPLADEIPLSDCRVSARQALSIPLNDPVIAILPGSRLSEVQRLAPPFFQTADWCYRRHSDLRFFVPCVSDSLRTVLTSIAATIAPHVPITFIDGRSRDVIAAADVVLTASGTATLETLLLKRPMVVGYRVHPLTWWFITRFNLVQVPYVAMANLLVNEELAPEFLQHRCQPSLLGPALLRLFAQNDRCSSIRERYQQVHVQLRCNAAQQAVAALLDLIPFHAQH